MSSYAVDLATLFVREVYHQIAPDEMPPSDYELGRALNVYEDIQLIDEKTTSEGHRVVCINDVFSDSDGNGFRVIDTLGNGTYSYVYQCQMVAEPMTFVALKILKNHPQYKATGINEINTYKTLLSGPEEPGQEYIIKPISSFAINDHICMVMPLLQRSLFEGIGQDQPPMVLLDQIRTICKQVLLALDFTHKRGFIHCDVKPDNIMYADENNDKVILIDFGSATSNPLQVGQYLQSRFYRSPEAMLGYPLSNKIDIWSVGCIAAELYLDFAIFACDTEVDSIHCIAGLLGDFDRRLIESSRAWHRFFDLTFDGYKLKLNPIEVLMTRHLYRQNINCVTGAVPLYQMLEEHFPLVSQEEVITLSSFSHFVHYLLKCDPDERMNASQALQHPFITGAEFSPDWVPPPELASPKQGPEAARLPMIQSILSVLPTGNELLSLF